MVKNSKNDILPRRVEDHDLPEEIGRILVKLSYCIINYLFGFPNSSRGFKLLLNFFQSFSQEICRNLF
ncbi:MAG: hypothetical protein EBS28_00535 [Chlamydiae bacterium]|nr:hypothetical protein [Chlamydiota bacterium]